MPRRGELWSVIGASGCGKSTLLHLIVGVRAASGGTITVKSMSENVAISSNLCWYVPTRQALETMSTRIRAVESGILHKPPESVLTREPIVL
jgi:ABC-type nitrate/sulfonate/bicarbonate transport system ATPase subunit